MKGGKGGIAFPAPSRPSRLTRPSRRGLRPPIDEPHLRGVYL
jgi:hypothetical protein